MTSSFVICTKDRPLDLKNCIESIMAQTILPKEIIIVDASNENTSYENQKNCNRIIENKITFVYIKSEPSTTKQRNIGVDNSNGDIIFFLDDDVILEKDYHENILLVYKQKSGVRIGGVRGTIGNEYPMSLFTTFLRRFFMLTRQSINEKSRFLRSGHYVYIPRPKKIIKVECMPAGVCSYYRRVFNEFKFDETLSGYALKEDMELSYRISRKYELYQTPYAILNHYHSKSSRISTKEVAMLRIINSYYLFKKNIPQTLINRMCFLWSLLGMIIIDLIRLLTQKDYSNVKGTLKGTSKILRQFFSINTP